MASVGKCKICGETLNYSPDEIASFGKHLLDKHGAEEITHFSFAEVTDCKCGCGCGCTCGKAADADKKAYKTTVESWRQGAVEQLCPNCGKLGFPLIRKQRNKVSKNSFGTLCLVGCWPLCFLPFLIGGSDIMYLFCQECGYFLGTYNRKNGQINPSCPIDSNEYGAKVCKCESHLADNK